MKAENRPVSGAMSGLCRDYVGGYGNFRHSAVSEPKNGTLEFPPQPRVSWLWDYVGGAMSELLWQDFRHSLENRTMALCPLRGDVLSDTALLPRGLAALEGGGP